MKLTGNAIFITGGGSGIGRGLAEAFHRLGNKVIVAGRRREVLDAVAAQLVRDFPPLNVLVNNARIIQPDTAGGRMDDVQMMSIDLYTVTGGRIARSWHVENWTAALRQLAE